MAQTYTQDPNRSNVSIPSTSSYNIPSASSIAEIKVGESPAMNLDTSSLTSSIAGTLSKIQGTVDQITAAVKGLQSNKSSTQTANQTANKTTTQTNQGTDNSALKSQLLSMMTSEDEKPAEFSASQSYTDILASLGYDQESLSKIAEYKGKLESLNNQVSSLEEQKAIDLGNTELKYQGYLTDAYLGEAAVKERQWNSRISAVSAKASMVLQEYNLEKGALEEARSAAKQAVEYMTWDYQQKVQDYKDAKETYKDLYKLMTEEEQNEWDKQYKTAQLDLDQQQLEWSNYFNQKELELSYAKFNATQEETQTGAYDVFGNTFYSSSNLSATEKQKVNTIKTGIDLVSQVENLYYDAVGEEYSGTGSGIWSRIKGVSRVIGEYAGTNQKMKAYKNFLDSNRAAIAKGIKGEVGNLAYNEQANALKSFPNEFSSPYEASQAFSLIKQQMLDQISKYGSIQEGTGGLTSNFDYTATLDELLNSM